MRRSFVPARAAASPPAPPPSASALLGSRRCSGIHASRQHRLLTPPAALQARVRRCPHQGRIGTTWRSMRQRPPPRLERARIRVTHFDTCDALGKARGWWEQARRLFKSFDLTDATWYVGVRESGAERPYAPASAPSVSAAPSIPRCRLYPRSQPHAVCPFKTRKSQCRVEVEM